MGGILRGCVRKKEQATGNKKSRTAHQPSLPALLDAEEHGAQLRQPVRVHCCHRSHILFGGEGQLVVHHVLGLVCGGERTALFRNMERGREREIDR